MGRLETTLEDLNTAAQKTDAVLVSYSGGKDSLCVMDMCVRTFKRVEAFHMYLIPGLECIEQILAEAHVRWGIKSIRQYPHPLLRAALLAGLYCPNHYSRDDLPEWKLFDVYNIAMSESQTDLVATGAKKADSIWRRKQMGSWGKDLLYPV